MINNQLSRKDKIILELIEKLDYISSKALAKKLGVSERTIRNDIKEVKEFLTPKGLQLENVNSKGYIIHRESDREKEKIQEIRNELLSLNKENLVPTLPKERVIFIINKLLINQRYVRVIDLADELFVSKMTISADIKEVRERLKKFNLDIVTKPHYGLKVVGSEREIRQCILKYGATDINRKIFKDIDINKIDYIVRTEVRKHKFQIYDVFLNNLTVHIAVAIKRIKDNCYIEKNLELVMSDVEKDLKLAEDIVSRLNEEFKLEFPESEKKYIIIHLAGKKVSKITENSDEVDNLYIQTNKLIMSVSEIYNYNFFEDDILRKDLYIHLKAALNRNKLGIKLRNPMLYEIKKCYPLAFEIGVYLCSKNIENNEILSEDEIAYVAVHFAASIERLNAKGKMKSKKTILISCASGIGTVRLLEVKLKKFFKDEVDIISNTSVMDWNEISASKYDLILTTVPVAQQFPNLLLVNAIPSKLEMEKIKAILFKPQIKGSYKIEDMFIKELFKIEEKIITKEDVLKELCDHLYKMGYVDCDFYGKVLEREEVIGTVVGDLLAIPHPIRSVANTSAIYTCILKEPIKWDMERKVQVIFLLAIKQKESKYFNKIYDLIVNIAEDIENINNISECKSYDEFIRCIKEISIVEESNY